MGLVATSHQQHTTLKPGTSYCTWGFARLPECLPPYGGRQDLQAGCAEPDDSVRADGGTSEGGGRADGCIIHFHDGARICNVQHRLLAQRQAFRTRPQNEGNTMGVVGLQVGSSGPRVDCSNPQSAMLLRLCSNAVVT